jgi:voltage-gated potassium channel
MYHATKNKVYSLLHPEIGNTRLDKVINTFIIFLIAANIVAVIIETVPSIYDGREEFFHYFDVVSVVFFTIEYLLRVWSANCEPKYKHRVHGRLRYMLSVPALVDLLAILPFFLHIFVGFDLRILRIFRLLRFFRLFRLTAYMKAAKLVKNVFKSTINELMLCLVLALFLIIISSSLVYFAEHQAQPDKFKSIPSTIWWSVVTLTTVGYGDLIPITPMGKIFTSIILLAGIAIFALPAGIITAGFLEEIRRKKTGKQGGSCPHCGSPLEDEVHENHH